MGFGDMQRSRIGRMHDGLAVLLGVLVPLTALPLASNRATWWLLWTAVFAAIALVYVLRFAVADVDYRVRALDHKVLAGFAMVLPAWALVQSLPIAGFLPAGWGAMPPGLGGQDMATLSVQPQVTLAGVLRFAGYIVLVALVLEVASRRDRVLRVAQIIYAGICLQAVWAVVALKGLDDFSPWGPKLAYLGSATGTFVNRNSLATFLGFGLVLGIGILAERARRSSIRATRRDTVIGRLGYGDLVVLVGMVFLLIGLIYTQSRLGLVASLSGAAITLMLVRAQSGARAGRVLAETVVIGLGAIAAVALVAAGQGVAERMLFLGNEAVNRLAIYEQTWGMIEMRPWSGFGMDAFGSAFEAFRAPPLLAPVTYDLAHNSYLMLWAEFGLVFGSVPIVALLAVSVLLLRRMRAEDGFGGMAAAGLGALVLGAIHSLADFSLEIPANVYVLMCIIGLGLGQQSRRRGRIKQDVAMLTGLADDETAPLVTRAGPAA